MPPASLNVPRGRQRWLETWDIAAGSPDRRLAAERPHEFGQFHDVRLRGRPRRFRRSVLRDLKLGDILRSDAEMVAMDTIVRRLRPVVRGMAEVVDRLPGAASIWLGALPAFLILLWRPKTVVADASQVLHRALHGFAAIGSGAVATLLATGLVNSWFLVGLEKVSALWTSDYGRLLSVKLLLFLLMLALAGANRYRLTPRLAEALEAGAPAAQALTALRRSLIVETGAGVAILALVAWLGTLAPASAV